MTRNGTMIFENDTVICCRYETNEIFRVKITDIHNIPKELYGSALNWCEVENDS